MGKPARSDGRGRLAVLRPSASAAVRAPDDVELRRRLLQLVRILPGRRDLDPAMHPARALLNGREMEHGTGLEVGEPPDEHELVVELVRQLAAGPGDLLDPLGKLAAEI